MPTAMTSRARTPHDLYSPRPTSGPAAEARRSIRSAQDESHSIRQEIAKLEGQHRELISDLAHKIAANKPHVKLLTDIAGR